MNQNLAFKRQRQHFCSLPVLLDAPTVKLTNIPILPPLHQHWCSHAKKVRTASYGGGVIQEQTGGKNNSYLPLCKPWGCLWVCFLDILLVCVWRGEIGRELAKQVTRFGLSHCCLTHPSTSTSSSPHSTQTCSHSSHPQHAGTVRWPLSWPVSTTASHYADGFVALIGETSLSPAFWHFCQCIGWCTVAHEGLIVQPYATPAGGACDLP